MISSIIPRRLTISWGLEARCRFVGGMAVTRDHGVSRDKAFAGRYGVKRLDQTSRLRLHAAGRERR